MAFAYTVQVGDNISDLDYSGTDALMLDGGAIQENNGYNSNLAIPAPGQTNSLSANSDLAIETPYLTANGASSVAEGSPYTLQLTAGNLGSRTVDTWRVDWGDGNVSTYSATTNPKQVAHVYADDGSYTITSMRRVG